MNTKLLKVFTSLGLLLSGLLLLPTGVLAQNSNSSFLPEALQNIFGLLGEDGGGTANFVTSRVRTGLFIALGVIVLVAVVYALIASFRYIQSQGDPGKIEEAQKAIKAIFFGIAAMFVAILGIVLVFVFFGGSRFDASLNQSCISAPGGKGCVACEEGDKDLCKKCNEFFAGEPDSGGDDDLCR